MHEAHGSLERELTQVFKLHPRDVITHTTPYVLMKLGMAADAPPELQEIILKAALLSGIDPQSSQEEQKACVEAFYKKYPPSGELAAELMRILKDSAQNKSESLKILGKKVVSFDPQPLDKSEAVAGGAMSRFAAAKLFDSKKK